MECCGCHFGFSINTNLVYDHQLIIQAQIDIQLICKYNDFLYRAQLLHTKVEVITIPKYKSKISTHRQIPPPSIILYIKTIIHTHTHTHIYIQFQNTNSSIIRKDNYGIQCSIKEEVFQSISPLLSIVNQFLLWGKFEQFPNKNIICRVTYKGISS